MKLYNNKKCAFTLAEVLITLGVIGVVAAITIPGLMTKYRKSVVENRLKKFYSTINQAVRLSIEEHDDIIFDTSALEADTEGSDSHAATNKNFEKEWYNEYILKYMTGVTTVDMQNGSNEQRGIKVSLNDGSGFTSFLYLGSNADLYLFYCINASDKSCSYNNYDGKNTFMFSYSPDMKSFVTSYANRRPTDFETLKNATDYGCYKGHKQYCTRLIEMNGWKIPDDYPWIK